MSDQTNNPQQFGPQGTGRQQPDTPPQHPNREALTPERAAGSHPEYHKGQLTHAGMKAVHANGGSVMYKGNVIAPGQPLPTEMDLAVGDEAAEQAVRDGIEVQRKALDEQERKLLAAQGQRKRAADEAAKSARNAPAGEDDENAPTFGTDHLTLAQLEGKSDEELLQLDGVGDATLAKIRKAQKKAAK